METKILTTEELFGKKKKEKEQLGSGFGGGWNLTGLIKEQEEKQGIKTTEELFGKEDDFEEKFQKAYKQMATKQGLSLDPDDTEHYYDYRALYEETGKLEPDETGHFPSKYKLEGHPRMVVEGIDTKTGESVSGVPKLEDIKIQENNLKAMSKTYSQLESSIDTDYKQYIDLGNQLDELEAAIQEAPPELQFMLNQKHNKLVTEHNTLVDKIKTNTKKYESLYSQLTEESNKYNENITTYNKMIQIQQDAMELPIKFDSVSEQITRQLKEGTYTELVGTEEIERESAFAGTVATFGMMLTKIPKQIAVGILQAAQGKDGASVVEPDWADKFIQKANEDIEGFVKEAKSKYGNQKFMGITISDLAQLPQNAGYSITSMAGGLAVGAPLAAVPLPGFRVAAYVAGTAASGTVAYNATTYQIMQTYLELKNPKTKAEEDKLKAEFDQKAHQYGLWEAIPEALSNLAFFSILTAPLTKMVGKSMAGKIVNKIAGLYGEELLTETITQMGQAGIEAEAGISEEEPRSWTSAQDWLTSFKEIYPQTFLLTTLLSGAGGSMIAAKNKVSKVEKSLEKEIGRDHKLFNRIMDNVKKKFESGNSKEEAPKPGIMAEQDYAPSNIKISEVSLREMRELMLHAGQSEEVANQVANGVRFKVGQKQFILINKDAPQSEKEEIKLHELRHAGLEERVKQGHKGLEKAEDIVKYILQKPDADPTLYKVVKTFEDVGYTNEELAKELIAEGILSMDEAESDLLALQQGKGGVGEKGLRNRKNMFDKTTVKPEVKPEPPKVEPKLPEFKFPKTREDFEKQIDTVIEATLPKLKIDPKLPEINIPEIREKILPKVAKDIESYAQEKLKTAAKKPDMKVPDIAKEVMARIEATVEKELEKMPELKVEPKPPEIKVPEIVKTEVDSSVESAIVRELPAMGISNIQVNRKEIQNKITPKIMERIIGKLPTETDMENLTTNEWSRRVNALVDKTAEEVIKEEIEDIRKMSKTPEVIFNEKAEHEYGKPFDKLTTPQKRKLIETVSEEESIVIPDKEGEYIKTIGLPTRGFEFPTEGYAPFYVTAKKEHAVTDSHQLITEPEAVKKLTLEWEDKILKKEIKAFKQAGMSQKEAETTAQNYLKKVQEETNPLDKKFIDDLFNTARQKTHEQPAQIQGHRVTGKDTKTTYLSDGQTQAAVNTNFLAFFDKYLPGYTLHLQDELSPILIKAKGKEAGLVMPIRVEDDLPFAIDDIEGEVKRPHERALFEETEEGNPLLARGMGEQLAIEPETKKRITKTEIMAWAENAFNIPIKGTATHKWRSAAGMYYPRQQIIRMEKWGELGVATHELAHSLDYQTFRKAMGRDWAKPNRKITKELADLDYNQGKSGRRTHEGFAEYMRYRLTTDRANEKAPDFHKYFNEEILPKFPDIKKKLDQFKEMLDTWNKQGAENRIIQHIDWKGEHTNRGLSSKAKKALEWVNVRFNDEFYYPRKITKEIEKALGKELPPTKNPALMMEYSKSKAGSVARTFVMEKAVDEYGNVVGDGLIDVLKPIPNKEMKQFISYAVAKRAMYLEARKIESGFDIEDAKYIIEKYKDKGWDSTVKELTKWSNHMLDWLVNAGALDKKSTEIMRALNPVYLPFKRAFFEDVNVTKGVGGYVDTGKGIKSIKGSGRPIINPLESMISQTTEMIAKAQKIRIAKVFIELAEEKGLGGFITKVPAPMKATTFNANQIKSYLDEIASGEEGMMSSNNYDELLTVFTQDFKYNGKDNIVSMWRNGKQEFYEIHPDLYEAFNGIDPLRLGPIGKVFAPFARMLRLGATGLKFSFGFARNPFRDALSYAVFSKRKNATVFDPIKGYYKDIVCKPGELTWRFKAMGGGLSGQIGFDRSSVQNTYDEMLDKKLGKIGKVLQVVKHPVNALSDILSITEMGPRSAEIEASYKNYTSEKWLKDHPNWTEEDAYVQAFLDAQDVTVNFTKSGKWAKQLNQVVAFFNVAIRGPEKLYRSFRERPIQTMVKGIAWLALPAILSWHRNKDKDWYKNLPPAYKYNNMWFEIGDNIYRLPIPFELGMVFMSAPQAFLDTYQGKDDQAIKGLMELGKAQIPIPMPSALAPVYEVAKNKNWLGNPIESPGMQYLYPTERKRDYTSKLAVALSKGADEIGIKLSPIQIDYLIDGYSGGFLKQFRISGEQLADYPVIGDLVLRNPGYPSKQLNNFFSDYELLGQKRSSGVASREELRKYSLIKGFYSYYKTMQDRIKRAEENKNNKLLKTYYKQMTDRLARYGYK